MRHMIESSKRNELTKGINCFRNKLGGTKKEVKVMKIIKAILITFLVLTFASGVAMAKVTGRCDNCHTMHNSQNGNAMVFSGQTGPIQLLVRGNCLGCHGDTSSANTIKQIGNSYVPVVYNGNEPTGSTTDTRPLAGGNFYWVANIGDAKGHNVYGVTDSEDGTLGNTPPGYNSNYDPSSKDFNTSYRLTCAGSNGCHGNRDIDTGLGEDYWELCFAAIKGAHHDDDGHTYGEYGVVNDGSTVGKSYRFLYHVVGGEDGDWQQTVNATDHNEYKGQTFATRTSLSWDDVDTISELCAECHGNFHMSGDSGIGSEDPWLRHPTDVVLYDSNYCCDEYTAYTTYNPLAPVARQTIPSSPSETVTPNSDIVACISCHRAHGSPYDDILRWDYNSCVAGSDNTNCGCFICHTKKDSG